MAPFMDEGNVISRPVDIAKMKAEGKQLYYIAMPFTFDTNMSDCIHWCSHNLTDAWNFQLRNDRYVDFVTNHSDAAILFKLRWYGTPPSV